MGKGCGEQSSPQISRRKAVPRPGSPVCSWWGRALGGESQLRLLAGALRHTACCMACLWLQEQACLPVGRSEGQRLAQRTERKWRGLGVRRCQAGTCQRPSCEHPSSAGAMACLWQRVFLPKPNAALRAGGRLAAPATDRPWSRQRDGGHQPGAKVGIPHPVLLQTSLPGPPPLSQPRSLAAEEANQRPHPTLRSRHPLQGRAGEDHCSWR